MHMRRPVALLAAATTPLLLGAASPQQAVPDFTCVADDQDGGPHNAHAIAGPPYTVSGRLKMHRQAHDASIHISSANAQIVSNDNRAGVYLIVAGEKEFLGETVIATLVQLRDGKRRDEYEIGAFKATATLRFTLSLDEKGVAAAQVGTRKVKLRADPVADAKAVFGCSLGTFTFSAVTLGGA